MLNKLAQIASWNFLSAFLNFALNYVLAKQLGNSFFGEFSLYSSKIALLGLIYILIPSNYAVVKFQEDKKFKTIYFSFHLISAIVFLGLLFVSVAIGYLNLPVYSMFLFSFPMFFINFFDSAFQAEGKLSQYFKILFFISLIKILSFFVSYYFGAITDLNDVVFSIGVANTLCILILFFAYRKSYFTNVYLLDTITFIKNNLKVFSGYYLNNIIKSLADNFFILLFNGILNKSQLGLFSLFMKAQTFSFSLFRILEAFLVNKKNNEKYYYKLNSQKYILGFLLFIITLIITMVYLYTLNSKVYILESLVVSTCAMSYVIFLMLRTRLILIKNNKFINITMIIEMIIMLIFIFFMNLFSISGTVLICLLFVLFSSVFRVFFLKNIMSYENI